MAATLRRWHRTGELRASPGRRRALSQPRNSPNTHEESALAVCPHTPTAIPSSAGSGPSPQRRAGSHPGTPAQPVPSALHTQLGVLPHGGTGKPVAVSPRLPGRLCWAFPPPSHPHLPFKWTQLPGTSPTNPVLPTQMGSPLPLPEVPPLPGRASHCAMTAAAFSCSFSSGTSSSTRPILRASGAGWRMPS